MTDDNKPPSAMTFEEIMYKRWLEHLEWLEEAMRSMPPPVETENIHLDIAEAIVRAALERAAGEAYVGCAETRHVTLGLSVSDRIRALAHDPEVITLLINEGLGK